MSNIYLPSTTGQFSNWRWFQVIFPISEIVKIQATMENKPVYRVKSVSEVEEIYSQKGVSNLLQRAFDKKRLEPLKSYLLKQHERYVNNLTIAIFGGEPEWLPINLGVSSLMEIDENYDENYWEAIGKCFGVIKLTGEEILFVLDGQHRVMALREAVKEDETLLQQKIAVTLISHEQTEEGRKATRRLFTTINRYAKPVSLGENILLDEDDLSAIIVRKFIDEYPLFQGKELVALNKTADLKLPRDNNKFTSVIALWSINEMIIDPKKVYPKYVGAKSNLVRIRPEETVIEDYKNIIFNFWDIFFDSFPKAKNFVNNVDVNIRNTGGPLSLRPLGQQVFCEFYLKMKSLNRLEEINIINIIPDDISNEFWHNILFDPIGQRIVGSKSFVRDYIFYHLNLPLTAKQQANLLRNYRKYKQNENAILPNKLIQ